MNWSAVAESLRESAIVITALSEVNENEKQSEQARLAVAALLMALSRAVKEGLEAEDKEEAA